MLVHAAAALPIQASRESIRSVNVGGTATLLAAAAEAGVRRHVLVSSTAVYGVPKVHPIYEDAPLVGVGWYGESKIEAEEVTRDFGRRGLEFAIVRPKTFVGPGAARRLRDPLRLDPRGPADLRARLRAQPLPAARGRGPRRRDRRSRPSGRRQRGETRERGRDGVRDRAGGPRRADRARGLGVAADVVPGEAGGDRAARARAAARLAARRVALQDGAPGLVRRRLERAAAARLGAALLERGGALPHVRLVPGAPRARCGGGRHPPRARGTSRRSRC